ncbi:MAG: hypothetical protein DRR19_22650 [Candidatus Parabeggiatoa sp. nov. 1]|nr:MAG: hypothetical protein DRR19_22650 [Gammaproteobacteria bacterium]
MKRVLVTGCNGYIGNNLVPKLRKQRLYLVGIDRQEKNQVDIDQFFLGDLNDESITKRALKDVDMVIHLAAAKDDWGQSEREYYRDNLDATRTLIRLGKEQDIKEWVFYSTVSVMGSSKKALDESATFNPMIAYGHSKAEAEKLFVSYSKAVPDAKVLTIRPSVVYGPNNPDNTNVYRLLDAIYHRRFIMIGRGKVIKTTSYIENMVEATIYLIERMKEGLEVYIYVDEPPLETGELVQQIYSLLGRKPALPSIPLWVAAPLALIADAVAALTKRDIPITSARISKFCRTTNFDGTKIRKAGFIQPFSNEEALEKTINWYLMTDERG